MRKDQTGSLCLVEERSRPWVPEWVERTYVFGGLSATALGWDSSWRICRLDEAQLSELAKQANSSAPRGDSHRNPMRPPG